ACSEIATDAVRSIEKVGHQVERVFAEVGGHLGTAHEIFGELNSGLNSLSGELSGAKIEGASIVFQDVAARLRGLADALPAETALIRTIGASAAQASILLKHLMKHIHLITVIARSSRIEAASLEGNRDDFLSFTSEASDLAAAVHSSITACSKEQEKLAGAIAMALSGQLGFEKRYRDRLLSVSADLISTFSGIKHLQTQGVEVAKLAKASTLQIGDAVGVAIISLQAGDSTRQRLEHVCRGLRMAADGAGGAAAPLVCLLQAAQLKDTVSEFDVDIGKVGRSLTRLSCDSAEMVSHGKVLYGGKNDDMTSFLVTMKQRLAEASVLISACGQTKVSVDASMAELENVLGKFRDAISALDETVVDITLIGMNAGLKASHLGEKGRAFVVIANELKQTADRISGAAKLLEPVLLEIGQAADQLKRLRLDEEPLNVADLEQSIAKAVDEIEGGNARLHQLMDHLTRESVQFETLMTGAKAVMSGLGEQFALLPDAADLLERSNGSPASLSSTEAREASALFEQLYLHYTMEIEREVHLRHCDRFGIAYERPAAVTESPADTEDVLFF
ncbi:MAG: methyl-accepting chemotaxis sensory transducer, partial [Rhizobium sp.]|nr:methyl-accepting chemotaxis sensory transducer [Rhizobium sp.]